MSSTVRSHLLAILASGFPENDSHPNSYILFIIRTNVTTLSIGVRATCGTYVAGATRGVGETSSLLHLPQSEYGARFVASTTVVRGGTSLR